MWLLIMWGSGFYNREVWGWFFIVSRGLRETDDTVDLFTCAFDEDDITAFQLLSSGASANAVVMIPVVIHINPCASIFFLPSAMAFFRWLPHTCSLFA
jgi:hypothetical protein